MAEVRIEAVTKTYGSVRAVDGFTASVGDGEFVTFLGPSGCGKTTALRSIAGFIDIDAGRVSIGDTAVTDAGMRLLVPPEERNIGMVFQSYAVWPHMNVFDNVAYPLRIRRVGKTQMRDRVERVLALVKMPELAHRFPHELSGGQQQRVALARALVSEPKVLLLDEPLSNLDAKLREELRVEIKELQRRMGITVILVTHDQMEAMVMSDRIVVMREGVIQQVGTATEIYTHPMNDFVAGFVGKANLLPLTLDSKAPSIAGGLPMPDLLEGGDPRQGGSVMVRPEDVRLSPLPLPLTAPAGGGAGSPASVRVAARFYLGESLLLVLEAGDLRLQARTQTEVTVREGDLVSVTFRRGWVLGGS
jgi:iron(III) transport system ATP-binding protein